MRRSEEGRGGGSTRSRGLAACLAAMLCAGCASEPNWLRPPKPRAEATVRGDPGVARNGAGGDKIRITTPDLAQAACPLSSAH